MSETALVVPEKKPWLTRWGWAMGLLPPLFWGVVFLGFGRAFIKDGKNPYWVRFGEYLHNYLPGYAHFRRATFLNILAYLAIGATTGWWAGVGTFTVLTFFTFFVPSPEIRDQLKAAEERKMLDE